MFVQVNKSKITEKLKETVKAVFPIIGIVMLLCFTAVPVSPSILMAFLIGAVLLIVVLVSFIMDVIITVSEPVCSRRKNFWECLWRQRKK